MGVILPPQTYSEWIKALEALKEKENDHEVLLAMQQGTIEWQSGVAERFIKQLTNTVNLRLNMASDQFQRSIKNANGQENLLIQALLVLRKELSFLFSIMNLSAIPEQERKVCCGLVQQQADHIQQSLESSAHQDRTGRMVSIIRNHKVNAF